MKKRQRLQFSGYVEELLTGSQLEMNRGDVFVIKNRYSVQIMMTTGEENWTKAPFISEIEEGAQPGNCCPCIIMAVLTTEVWIVKVIMTCMYFTHLMKYSI